MRIWARSPGVKKSEPIGAPMQTTQEVAPQQKMTSEEMSKVIARQKLVTSDKIPITTTDEAVSDVSLNRRDSGTIMFQTSRP
mmetsp:Transcript_29922/g.72852  ORF Transcript_29922/g.72852 Transcript_29922/m.72852 type:complete len:82 (-) Transcript_29922:170-415(-)